MNKENNNESVQLVDNNMVDRSDLMYGLRRARLERIAGRAFDQLRRRQTVTAMQRHYRLVSALDKEVI